MRGFDGKKLPEVGDVFVFPLDKKLRSFCWIVRGMKPRYGYSSKLKKWMDSRDMVIACATWVGDDRDPTAEEIAARKLLYIGKQPLMRCDCNSPPKGFRKVGVMKKASIGEKTVENYSGYKAIRDEARRQWLRDHDRRRLLAEEAAEAAADREDAARDAAEEKLIDDAVKKRKRATKATIGKLALLPDWIELVEKRHHTAVDKLLRELVTRLRAAKTLDAKRGEITRTVEKINAWNDRTGVIETPEREALATAIDDIGHAFGVKGHDLAGDTRDW